MIEWNYKKINIKRQAELLSVNRSSVYRPERRRHESDVNIAIMHRIDEIYTEHPYFGYRRMTAFLRDRGYAINRKRVRRLMRLMRLIAIYPKPNLSKRLHAKYCHPYLLRSLMIGRPNQVWGIDITYIRMGKGFMYLFNIIDWYSRKVIDYELSNTLEKGFVMKCLERAFKRCKPEIMNSDQGAHFTNADYVNLLTQEGVKISMDGKGRATDNSRTERYFRALKYECIYLNEFEDPRALRKGIAKYVQFYNQERPHQSLNDGKPDQFYAHSVEKLAS